MMKKALLLILSVILLLVAPVAAMATEVTTQLEGSTCNICHVCPHPYGFCVLLWAAAILVLLLVLVIVIGKKKKCPVCKAKNRRRDQHCYDCGYEFATGALPLLGDQPLNAPIENPSPAQMAGGVWQDRSATANKPIPPASSQQEAPMQPVTPPTPAPPPPAGERKDCPKCGRSLPARAVFCASCGKRLVD